jgi:hypothetical protein
VGQVATLLPQVERLGVATAAGVDLDTLRDRLMNKTVVASSLLVGRSEIGTWCRV